MAQFAIPWLFEYRVLARLHVFVLLAYTIAGALIARPLLVRRLVK